MQFVPLLSDWRAYRMPGPSGIRLLSGDSDAAHADGRECSACMLSKGVGRERVGMRVQVQIMGSQSCGIVGISQPVLIMTNPIPTCTCS
eukprot:COSAG01_NODE_4406_length_5056_cov_124.577365_11_plen_89_part_00